VLFNHLLSQAALPFPGKYDEAKKNQRGNWYCYDSCLFFSLFKKSSLACQQGILVEINER
jgi:hypothetical protein